MTAVPVRNMPIDFSYNPSGGKMFDPIDDEIKIMDEQEVKGTIGLVRSIDLSDPIREFASKRHQIMPETATLQEVVNCLHDAHQPSVLLVKNDRLTGIFTERDLLDKVAGRRLDFDREIVRDFMTPDPQILHLDDPIAYALNLMVDGGFRTVPLIDENRQPVGVIHQRTLLKHIADYFHKEVLNLPPNPSRESKKQHGG